MSIRERIGMKQNKEGKYGSLYVIGVTGGVGAGKSTVLKYLQEKYRAKVYLADEIAKELLMPGQDCYKQVRTIFPPEVFAEDGNIHREKMAALIFAHPEYRQKQNDIVFPAVKEYFRRKIEEERAAGTTLLIIEAALLIEEHYEEICDELWYIYADESVRRKRLADSRGYSQEKITAIMASQLSEEEFIQHTDVMIDNSFDEGKTHESIDRILQDYV